LTLLAAPPTAPIRIEHRLPPTLDLRDADPTSLVPQNPKDPAQGEVARMAWQERLLPYQRAEVLRLILPAQGPRVPALLQGLLGPRTSLPASRMALLLAANQALKAVNPACRLYLAYQAGEEPFLDEAVWGALDGGILLPGDLGADPLRWRDVLAQAQAQVPGRPWELWLDRDPGPLAGSLLGDGGILVVPDGGPSARLAKALPPGTLDLEGGLGDLIATPRETARSQRWTYVQGGWEPTPLPQGRTEVAVAGQRPYEVGTLLAKVRAARLRNLAALRTLEARFVIQAHQSANSGPGTDSGITLELFSAAGEGNEMAVREVTLNGVRLNLPPGFRFPLDSGREECAFVPIALTPTEHFHYWDGGPSAPGRRWLKFKAMDGDPALPEGELDVEESSGTILRQVIRRSGPRGLIRNEEVTAEFGEVLPGIYTMVRSSALMRVLGADGQLSPLRVQGVLQDPRVNQEDFFARREAARTSDALMLKATPSGTANYVRKVTKP
jgi:hypothetical protein